MKKLIAILLILSTPAYADNAITVRTGDVVTKEFDQGTLLDKGQANKIKDELIEKDGLVKENESFKKSVDLYESNKKLYQEENALLLNRNIQLTETVNSTRTTSTLEKIGYVLLGAAMIYGGSRLTR